MASGSIGTSGTDVRTVRSFCRICTSADVSLWDFPSPRVAAQHTPAVVEPVGDRRSTWWVLAELGRRLGHDLAGTGGEPTSGDTADDAGVDDAGADDAVLARLVGRARCTYDELVGAGWVERPHELPAPWVDAHVERLGGWRLAPRLLVDQLATLPTPADLVLVPRRQVRRLNSQFGDLGEVAEVIVHPHDATAAGVADGDPVVVRSARGELVGVAKVDPTLRRGVVSVPHGHQAANVNRLTSKDDIDPVTGMAHYSGFAVSLHRTSSQRQRAGRRG